jgi:CRP-like cAMP-binding protein
MLQDRAISETEVVRASRHAVERLVLFEQDELADRAYILVSGRLHAVVGDAAGGARIRTALLLGAPTG